MLLLVPMCFCGLTLWFGAYLFVFSSAVSGSLIMLSAFLCMNVLLLVGSSSPLVSLCVLTINLLSALIFSVDNVLLWFIAYEAVLLPVFLWILLCSPVVRRIKAGYYLLAFSLLGGILLLCGLSLCALDVGSWSYSLWLDYGVSYDVQMAAFPLIFIGLSVKVPLFPMHLWLTEAHVEASTGGSMLLAGVMLKFGGYGMYKFLVLLCGDVTFFWLPLVQLLALCSLCYGLLLGVLAIDFKRILAYCSVGHMGLYVLALFSASPIGLAGALFEMISHGLLASSAFFIYGSIYNRIGTRNLLYLGGLLYSSPVLGFMVLVLLLFNLSLPGGSMFPGELLSLLGLSASGFHMLFVLSGLSILFGSILILRLLVRTLHGSPRLSSPVNAPSRIELLVFSCYLLLILSLGFCPNVLLSAFS